MNKATNQLELATQRIAYLEDLVRKYKFDKLTGMLKDQDFDEAFHRVFEEQKFNCISFTLVIADINNLHNVNKQGWEVGNELIKKVAEQLQDIFEIHQCYRIGGDEFCMLVRETTMSYETIVEKMKTVSDITFAATKSDGYMSPTQMFTETDAALTKLKLARPDLEERL